METINIKLIFSYANFNILKQTPQCLGRWGNYKFLINDEPGDYDYLVVFEGLSKPKEFVSCPKENTIYLALEPAEIKKYDERFLRQFHYVITCQREIRHPNKVYFLQGHVWLLDKSYDFLVGNNVIKKTKKISIICSDKQYTEGHRKRLEFCNALKDYFGDSIDFFGRGIRDFEDKWDALASYKYSVAMENSEHDDYSSEKLFECYLAHTFPIYYGCPNLEKYFSEKSFLKIDIEDLEGAKRLIEKLLIDDSHYEKNLECVIEAKNKYLQNYNIFPLIINFIESRHLNPKAPRKTRIIYRDAPSITNYYLIITSKLRNFIKRKRRIFPDK